MIDGESIMAFVSAVSFIVFGVFAVVGVGVAVEAVWRSEIAPWWLARKATRNVIQHAETDALIRRAFTEPPRKP